MADKRKKTKRRRRRRRRGGTPAALILLCLEKKNLVSIDYSTPLKGFSYAGYEKYPVKGSVALTNRGQQVLDLLEKQGIQE